MQLKIEEKKNVIILSIQDNFMYQQEEFKSVINALLNRPQPKFIIHLEDKITLNTVEIREIISVYNKISVKNGTMSIVCRSAEIKKMFDTVKLSNIVTIFNDLNEALKNFIKV